MANEPTIDRFVSRLRGRHRVMRVVSLLASRALVVAVVLLILVALPRLTLIGVPIVTIATVVGVAWLAFVACLAWVRTAAPIEVVDASLRLRDRLRTYLGLTTAAPPAFAAWLSRDLAGEIARLPPDTHRRFARIELGWLRYLVPVVVLLFLLQMFAPILPPNTPSPDGPSAGGSAGDGDGEGPSGGSDDTPDSGDTPSPSNSPPSEPPPEPPPPDTAEPPPESPPRQDPAEGAQKPLLELPVVDEFVVPEFVGDGASRKELARVAERGAPPPSAPAPARPSAGRPDRPPDPAAPEFARREEEALRARTVLPVERPFVQRYFDLLHRLDAERRPAGGR